MQMHKTEPADLLLADLLLIEPNVYDDERGAFLEVFREERFRERGLGRAFVQDNLSRSKKHVLRGLHYQLARPQAKLVTVISGAAYDVAVDLRRSSSTFLRWFGVELNDKNRKQLYIPEGFAHGFLALSDSVDFYYKCTDYYDPASEVGIPWNDPTLAIDWPIREPMLSQKDCEHVKISDRGEEYFFD